MKKLVLLAVVFLGPLILSATVSADTIQSQVQVIHIRGIVPEMRVLYVQNGQLIKIGGNTTKNVTPTALDVNTNNATALTSHVSQQYQIFLLMHNNRLEPGYYSVPLINPDRNSPSGKAMSVSMFKLAV